MVNKGDSSMAIKVNGELLSDAAIEYELGRLIKFYSQYMDASQVREQMGLLKKKAEEQAIGAKLLMIDAARMDFHVPGDLVQKKFDELVQSAGGVEKFNQMIKKQGLAIQGIMENFKEGCKVDMLISKITEGVTDPTEKEIEEHFNAHALEYRKPERAQAQHILIKPASNSDEDKEHAWKRLEDIRENVKKGADFAEMAQAHSDCPSGKSNGGSLGWFARHMMVPEFDDVVFAMEIDHISDIVETEFGYHIIKKLGHEKSSEASFDDVRESVRDFLRHAKRGDLLSAYVKELKDKAKIEKS